jgi:hypothetical protein
VSADKSPAVDSATGRVGLGVCLLLIVLLYLGQAASYLHYVNDDAYITFRYAANLAHGQGPYYNQGEHVEGYTNPLLMLIVSAAIRMGGTAVAAPAAKLVGVASGAVCVALAFLLGRGLWPPGRRTDGAGVCGLLAAGLVAVSPTFAVNSTSGLETTLFAACVCSGVALGLRAQSGAGAGGGGLAFALAGLARPEGNLIFAAFWLVRLATLAPRAWPEGGWRGLRRAARRAGLAHDAAIVSGVFVVQLSLRAALYDGELLPNTFYAKIGGFEGIAPWTYVRSGSLAPFLGPLGLALGLLGLWLGSASPALVAPLVAASLVGATEPLWAATDWMPGWRLVVPYLPLLAAWVAVGWCCLLASLRPLARIGPLLALATLPLFWLAAEPERRALLGETLLRAQGYQTGHRALGRWLRAVLKPGEAVALMDIGIVGYSALQARVIDITGLTDRFIAKSAGSFLDKSYDPRYVLERRPKCIVVVLTAPGLSYQRPQPGSAFVPWRKIEDALLSNPEFKRRYVRPRPVRAWERWPRDLAASIGAAAIFEHAHPGRHYLLAVFEAHEG